MLRTRIIDLTAWRDAMEVSCCRADQSPRDEAMRVLEAALDLMGSLRI